MKAQDLLLGFKISKSANIVIKMDGEMPILLLEHCTWDGIVFGNVSVADIKPEIIHELGTQLIKASVKLKEIIDKNENKQNIGA